MSRRSYMTTGQEVTLYEKEIQDYGLFIEFIYCYDDMKRFPIKVHTIV